MFQDELNKAVAAVRIAMRVCRRVQSAITEDVLEKKDRSPVTVADFASQAIICRALGESFPDDPVIGEEDSAELRGGQAAFLDRIREELAAVGVTGSGEEICSWIDRGGANDYSTRFWTLDPIDGTKGFLRGGQYAVSLALVVDGELKVGLLGCPNFSEQDVPNLNGEKAGVIFGAVRGSGAWAEAEQSPETRVPIQVTQTTISADARLCESVESGHSSHGHSAQVAEQLGITADPLRMDSQAKYAAVACGLADIYLRLPTRKGYQERIWDHGGGVIVVQEAGGTVTDVRGKPLEFTHGSKLAANEGVTVTNGKFHSQVTETVQRVLG